MSPDTVYYTPEYRRWRRCDERAFYSNSEPLAPGQPLVSLGRASYYVTPRQRQEGEQTVDEVYAEAWTGPICYEQCTPERTAAFPVTEEGLAQLRTWLEDNLAQIDQAARQGG